MNYLADSVDYLRPALGQIEAQRSFVPNSTLLGFASNTVPPNR